MRCGAGGVKPLPSAKREGAPRGRPISAGLGAAQHEEAAIADRGGRAEVERPAELGLEDLLGRGRPSGSAPSRTRCRGASGRRESRPPLAAVACTLAATRSATQAGACSQRLGSVGRERDILDGDHVDRPADEVDLGSRGRRTSARSRTRSPGRASCRGQRPHPPSSRWACAPRACGGPPPPASPRACRQAPAARRAVASAAGRPCSPSLGPRPASVIMIGMVGQSQNSLFQGVHQAVKTAAGRSQAAIARKRLGARTSRAPAPRRCGRRYR